MIWCKTNSKLAASRILLVQALNQGSDAGASGFMINMIEITQLGFQFPRSIESEAGIFHALASRILRDVSDAP